MSRSDKRYCKGLALVVFGAAGMAENITSGQGVFMVAAVIFAVGFGFILWSYVK
jgi:hypothetical protein